MLHNTAYAVSTTRRARLHKWLRELGRPPSQQELDRIVSAMLDAPEMIHSKDLLHRDISPDNIMICKDSSPVLIDFGSARKTLTGAGNMSAVVKGYSPWSNIPQDRPATRVPGRILLVRRHALFRGNRNPPPPSPERAMNDA